MTNVARTGKPIIISTGVATLSDIDLAVQTCRKAGNEQIILLQCTTAYPAPIESANLGTIPNLVETFDVIGGLSDHTLGSIVPSTSVALGGKVIEKHFMLDKSIGGADASFSMEPDEFARMVEDVRNAEKAMGKIAYKAQSKTSDLAKLASRSLFIVKDMKAGEVLTPENVRSIRPGFGIHPKYYSEILGKTVTLDIEKGTPLSFDIIV